MPSYYNQGIANSTEYDGTTLASSSESVTTKWDGNTQDLLGIGHGSAGMIFAWEDKVVKVYLGSDGRSIDEFESERQAYRNMASNKQSCQHVLKCYDLDNPHGLVLERCQGTLRRRIRSRGSSYSPKDEALRLAIEAAKGLAFVHKCGIIQGDVGCHNMLLDYEGTLKIADFAGSSVEGCDFPPSVDYEVGSKLPGEIEPSIRTDLFALGSAIYEMVTQRPPYKGRSYAEIQRSFMHDRFPQDFENFEDLRPIVEKCWGKGDRYYASADEVLLDLHKLGPWPSHINVHPSRKELYAGSTNHTSYRASAHTSAPRQLAQKPAMETVATQYVSSSKNKKRTRKNRKSQYYCAADDPAGPRHHQKKYPKNSFDRLVTSFHSLLLGPRHTRASRQKTAYYT